jgi:TRAP-type mannitol/chloroaromatic compound transport system substrate-binding protein
MTTRRDLLAGAAGAAATVTLAAPALSQGLVEWKLVTAWPKDMVGAGTGAQRLADRITQLTDGKLRVVLHAAGELVPGLQGMDAVMDGTAEMAHDAAYYHLARSPGFAFFTATPMGLLPQEFNAWLRFGGGQQLWDRLTDRFGLKAYAAGNTGVQMGGWFRNELKSVDDLKGKKFRMPGLGGQAIAKLGMTQILLPGGEILENLKTGAIDGTEWIGPLNDLDFGFHEFAKFYYWPGFHEPGSAFQLQVNRSKLEALPKSIQAAIEVAAAETNESVLADYNARSPAALVELITQHGVQLRQFPADIFQAFANAAGDVMQEVLDSGDDVVKAIAGSYFKFRDETLIWTRIADQGYANMRLLEHRYPKAG